MGSKEDAGKRCPAAGGGVSSFSIQSILGGGPSEAPREPAGWPARTRSLSVSSEEEEPDDGWKAPACFCPDPRGPTEPGARRHAPIPFPGLGKDRRPAAALPGRDLCSVAAPLAGALAARGPGSEGRRRARWAPRALGRDPGAGRARGAGRRERDRAGRVPALAGPGARGHSATPGLRAAARRRGPSAHCLVPSPPTLAGRSPVAR